MKNPEPDFYACLSFDCFLKNEHEVLCKHYHATDATFRSDIHSGEFSKSPTFSFKFGHNHGLRTPRQKIAFTARPKIHSHSQIFRYGGSIFCLPHRPEFSGFFDFCLHWVSVVRVISYLVSNIVQTFQHRIELFQRLSFLIYCFIDMTPTLMSPFFVKKNQCFWRKKKMFFYEQKMDSLTLGSSIL